MSAAAGIVSRAESVYEPFWFLQEWPARLVLRQSQCSPRVKSHVNPYHEIQATPTLRLAERQYFPSVARSRPNDLLRVRRTPTKQGRAEGQPLLPPLAVVPSCFCSSCGFVRKAAMRYCGHPAS